MTVENVNNGGFIGENSSALVIKNLVFDSASVTTNANKSQTYAGVVMGKNYAVIAIDNVTVAATEKGKNVLIIKDGYADMTDASCPDGLCVRQHKINESGESLVCLPNKVTVTVVGDDGVDIIG